MKPAECTREGGRWATRVAVGAGSKSCRPSPSRSLPRRPRRLRNDPILTRSGRPNRHGDARPRAGRAGSPAVAMTDRRPSAGELAVGDVRLTRTFRIGPNGELFPVNTADAWADGWNIATCRRGLTHTPPDPDCRCGFYLYSDPAYVLSQPPGRQVLAVVAVNGTMEAGSRGARVERARIEAIWLGRRVSDQLTAEVRARYRSVAVYWDRAAMYA